MIEINNLNFQYENNVIFENAKISIPKNKITMIVGPNGVGKTTLLKIFTGELKATGEFKKNYKKIFYLPQKLDYPKNISTFDYISSIFFKDNWKWFLTKEEKEKIKNVLEQIELTQRKDVKIDSLSAGELQKVNIAIGLLSDADLFLLDEPTSNMDLVNQIKILDMIKNLTKSGITSVIIMHDLNLSSSYGDYFIGINQNHKIIKAEKQDFFKPEVLNDIYNISFKVVNNEEKFYIQIFN